MNMRKALKLVIEVIYFSILPFFVFGQIQPATELLGKKYNKVYDKNTLYEYNHKIYTDSNMVVQRVDIYVVLGSDSVDLINHLLDFYKNNCDSISYDVSITPEFEHKDLVFINGVSTMIVYSDKFMYVFVLDRKKLTLEHYLK